LLVFILKTFIASFSYFLKILKEANEHNSVHINACTDENDMPWYATNIRALNTDEIIILFLSGSLYFISIKIERITTYKLRIIHMLCVFVTGVSVVIFNINKAKKTTNISHGFKFFLCSLNLYLINYKFSAINYEAG